MSKNKFYSECCNAEVYYTRGNYRCGKCNMPVALVYNKFDKVEMPKPKRAD